MTFLLLVGSDSQKSEYVEYIYAVDDLNSDAHVSILLKIGVISFSLLKSLTHFSFVLNNFANLRSENPSAFKIFKSFSKNSIDFSLILFSEIISSYI